ncbi:MAG: hypothetical protein LBH98_06450 [Chitinispirillales bacterium]|jgi:hypothetical protein|nr:hypothetical protein [Chitinispirillales bacterium]
MERVQDLFEDIIKAHHEAVVYAAASYNPLLISPTVEGKDIRTIPLGFVESKDISNVFYFGDSIDPKKRMAGFNYDGRKTIYQK